MHMTLRYTTSNDSFFNANLQVRGWCFFFYTLIQIQCRSVQDRDQDDFPASLAPPILQWPDQCAGRFYETPEGSLPKDGRTDLQPSSTGYGKRSSTLPMLVENFQISLAVLDLQTFKESVTAGKRFWTSQSPAVFLGLEFDFPPKQHPCD